MDQGFLPSCKVWSALTSKLPSKNQTTYRQMSAWNIGSLYVHVRIIQWFATGI